MKYRVQIEQYKQDTDGRERSDTIYSQVVEDLDVAAVIRAANGISQLIPWKHKGE